LPRTARFVTGDTIEILAAGFVLDREPALPQQVDTPGIGNRALEYGIGRSERRCNLS